MKKETKQKNEETGYIPPVGVISAEDDRILDGLIEFIKENSNEKDEDVLGNRARMLSTNFGRLFVVAGHYDCAILRQVEPKNAKELFFKQYGIDVILQIKTIKELENRIVINVGKTPEILDDELSAIKFALTKLEFKK